MKESKLEKVILYIVVYILIGSLLSLILYMSFSFSNFHIEPDLWGPISTFLGSLFGALLTGIIAVIILLYQIRHNNKENHFRRYRSMKYISSKLLVYPELRRFIIKVFDNIDILPQEIPPDSIKKAIELIPVDEFINLQVLLEKERENIPYDFVARYFTVVNSLDYTINALEK
ncbi:hypothetical protein PB01_08575 [Psychrobacillus glaciei]|uniref:Uncharacterized protein n=1 Tax=Psychrobacillus glaciei TaxID=2283160 RepID=A0A5J6SN70_9BACI|nr:hypothetical protein [Psychrobacillus glaciei]QFF98883.1 hypothetical protein PB01_08575 [Psychrobacillus glaciei]